MCKSVKRMADVKSGDIVVPGDQLCVIEELMPSFGTYEKDGIVYAAAPGTVDMNLKERSIRIISSSGGMKLALPEKGDILLGEVTIVFDQRAEIKIVRINDVDYHSGLIGELHISNVTRRYVKSMQDVLKQNDIVRAAALNTHEIPVKLTLVGPELGVVFAECVKCGNALTLTTHNNMFCLRCENRETREVANDYGLRFGLEARPDLAPRRRSYESRPYDRDNHRDRGGRRFDGPRGRGGDRHDRRGGSWQRNTRRR
jgi:exosome complex component CSL4